MYLTELILLNPKDPNLWLLLLETIYNKVCAFYDSVVAEEEKDPVTSTVAILQIKILNIRKITAMATRLLPH